MLIISYKILTITSLLSPSRTEDQRQVLYVYYKKIKLQFTHLIIELRIVPNMYTDITKVE